MKFFNTFLKPSESVMVSLATAAMVYGVYQYSMPSVSEVHATEPHNQSLDQGRKKAMWTSAGVVGGVFLLTHDSNVFIIGGLTFLALEWSYRHANSTHPATGKMVPKSAVDMLNMGYAMPDATPTDGEYAAEYWG
jgi:hypothetical protein